MKIHRHPSNPTVPSIFVIANTSNPLNVLAIDTTLKNIACLSCSSPRVYYMVR
jgi:hypothetical protein